MGVVVFTKVLGHAKSQSPRSSFYKGPRALILGNWENPPLPSDLKPPLVPTYLLFVEMSVRW